MAHIWVGTSSSSLSAVQCPSGFTWGEIIVSDEDAGRLQNARMYVNEVAKKVQISLSWNGITGDEAATILSAFRHEYFYMKYLDPVTNSYVTKEFYHGDFSAPVYAWWDRGTLYESISFDVIER